MSRICLLMTFFLMAFGCRDNAPCPDGTKRIGDPPPQDIEQWCEKSGGLDGAVRHGPYNAWYADGKMKEEGKYEDGKKVGMWIRYHKNGKKAHQVPYKNDKMDGMWVKWDPKGRKIQEGKYVNGGREGVWKDWFEDGKIKTEGHWKKRRACRWMMWRRSRTMLPHLNTGWKG